MSKIVQAYQFALEPSAAQVSALRSHCGAQRFAFNWGLARVKANLSQRSAEASYGVEGADLTPSLDWSAYSLRKAWNAVKDEVASWWSENSKEAYSSGLANDPAPGRPDTAVGVDLGVRSLAVLSTGEVVPNPKHLEVAQRDLRRLQRQALRRCGPDRRTKAGPSSRWRQTQTRIAKLHTRVAVARRDVLHKLTTRLVRTFGTIVIEDLKLCLTERTYYCDQRSLVLDRDLNAARNLAGLVEASSPSCGATRNEPDGNPRKTIACGAAGTATGRPMPPGMGQRRHGNVSAQDTFSYVS